MAAILAIAFLAAGGFAVYLVAQSQGQSVGDLVSSISSDAGDIVSGGNLTAAQIAAYAQNAGFSGDDLATAVAIALAESSGNPNAYNPETAAGAPAGQGSYGLWQIYLHMHPEYSADGLKDPQTNANAAYAVYSAAGSAFTPWSTFNGGQYESYLDQAQSAVDSANA